MRFTCVASIWTWIWTWFFSSTMATLTLDAASCWRDTRGQMLLAHARDTLDHLGPPGCRGRVDDHALVAPTPSYPHASTDAHTLLLDFS